MPGQQQFCDQLSLLGDEPDVYEAIATLEFLGKPVRAPDIVTATRLSQAEVAAALADLTKRGIVTRNAGADDPCYEPAYRGWSAVPDQPTGPHPLASAPPRR